MIRARFLPSPMVVLLGLLPLCTGSFLPNAVSEDFLFPQDAERLGLEEAWRRPLSLPAGSQSIVEMRLHVHGNDPDQYIEVFAPTVKPAGDTEPKAGQRADEAGRKVPQETIYARIMIDPTGQMAGRPDRAEAERLARNEIRRLKRRGIQAKSRAIEVPRVRLYTLGDDGTLEARNAETGELVWLQRVGNRTKGYSGIGVDDELATVVNGGKMIKLDIANGQVIREIALEFVPLAGAVHCGDYAVVPSIGGRMAGYPLRDLELEPFAERVSGAALSVPTVAVDAGELAWGTANGFVYLLSLEQGSPVMHFRLNVDGLVSGQLAAAPGERFFFGSEGGQLYAVRATRTGEVIWNRPTGEPIYAAPTIKGDQILFLTAYGTLVSVSAEDGYSTWNDEIRGIRNVLGIIDDRLYARRMSGSFVVLSLKTGETLETLSSLYAREAIVNRVTDRLYLINDRGTVQCLRPIDGELVSLTNPMSDGAGQDDDEASRGSDSRRSGNGGSNAQQREVANSPFPAADGDPFGAGGDEADPFGAGGDDPFGGDPFGAGDDDPFGGDPFGAGAGGDADPFGAGGDDDPFGASPF